ncbi:MAG TPA: LytR C-terminal domain-containing protein [Candidatus Fimivivens sp.]|nr:LytR C-terminal domain-containing protein [Candidatus Fimivivens sp.]
MESQKDELFGKLVLIVTGIVCVSIVAYFIYLGYRASVSASTDRTSIVSLHRENDSQEETSADTESAQDAVSPAPDAASSLSKDTLAVLVLNGGAPKGSAAILADILKSAGFAKVTTGNTDADYSGIVVYRQDGNDEAAESVKDSLSKKYPSVTVLPADVKIAETTKAPVVVIYGK